MIWLDWLLVSAIAVLSALSFSLYLKIFEGSRKFLAIHVLFVARASWVGVTLTSRDPTLSLLLILVASVAKLVLDLDLWRWVRAIYSGRSRGIKELEDITRRMFR